MRTSLILSVASLCALLLTACGGATDNATAPSNSEVMREPDIECFTSNALAEFPWPFPQYSVAQTVPRAVLFGDVDPAGASLEDVAERIESGLDAAGYVERAFYSIGCDGFAVVTRLEQIDADGAPVPGAERFEPVDDQEPFSLARYLSQLFYAPPGFYRQITFVVTTKPVRGDGSETTEAELDALLEAGADALPDVFSAAPFTQRHDVTALIYEFRADGDQDAEALIPGRIPGQSHLDISGISAALSVTPD
ncbi:MAG: hypothetical protein AAGJ32_08400 [Pseudomonadota bacterium]